MKAGNIWCYCINKRMTREPLQNLACSYVKQEAPIRQQSARERTKNEGRQHLLLLHKQAPDKRAIAESLQVGHSTVGKCTDFHFWKNTIQLYSFNTEYCYRSLQKTQQKLDHINSLACNKCTNFKPQLSVEVHVQLCNIVKPYSML